MRVNAIKVHLKKKSISLIKMEFLRNKSLKQYCLFRISLACRRPEALSKILEKVIPHLSFMVKYLAHIKKRSL
jgi:hypothetical protein